MAANSLPQCVVRQCLWCKTNVVVSEDSGAFALHKGSGTRDSPYCSKRPKTGRDFPAKEKLVEDRKLAYKQQERVMLRYCGICRLPVGPCNRDTFLKHQNTCPMRDTIDSRVLRETGVGASDADIVDDDEEEDVPSPGRATKRPAPASPLPTRPGKRLRPEVPPVNVEELSADDNDANDNGRGARDDATAAPVPVVGAAAEAEDDSNAELVIMVEEKGQRPDFATIVKTRLADIVAHCAQQRVADPAEAPLLVDVNAVGQGWTQSVALAQQCAAWKESISRDAKQRQEAYDASALAAADRDAKQAVADAQARQFLAAEAGSDAKHAAAESLTDALHDLATAQDAARRASAAVHDAHSSPASLLTRAMGDDVHRRLEALEATVAAASGGGAARSLLTASVMTAILSMASHWCAAALETGCAPTHDTLASMFALPHPTLCRACNERPANATHPACHAGHGLCVACHVTHATGACPACLNDKTDALFNPTTPEETPETPSFMAPLFTADNDDGLDFHASSL